MWKGASKSLLTTFHKSVTQNEKLLSAKVREKRSSFYLLNSSPSIFERFSCSRLYENNQGKFSKGKQRSNGSYEKRASFLGVFRESIFDMLKWSGVLVLGYCFLQQFKLKRLKNIDWNNKRTTSACQATLAHLINGLQFKSFNNVLPEFETVNTKTGNENKCHDSPSENTRYEDSDSLEEAHDKVTGVLNNWLGFQFMESGNHEDAIQFFIQSANQGNPAGLFNLGICYEKGLGISKNFTKAAELYLKASELGHAEAMYNLGVFYIQGLGGVEQDVDRARTLFKAAAVLGQKDAKRALIMEDESCREIHDDKILDPDDKKESPIKQFLLNSALYQATSNFIEDLKIRRNKVDISDVVLFNCDSKKESNSSSDNDSGVLDLSPRIDANIFEN